MLSSDFKSSLVPGIGFRRSQGSVLAPGNIDGQMRWVPANNSSMSGSRTAAIPLIREECETVNRCFLTHDDVLGIRMDAISNFNLETKRQYSGLIKCPCCGINLFIETTKYCTKHLNIGPQLSSLSVNWFNTEGGYSMSSFRNAHTLLSWKRLNSVSTIFI
jgi:hypothetical protein